ncbi:bifunctional diguanylate cyclase/phosphodiesterase [Psychromonas hadalis]|uniref:bifunctional diguanylate cyclase/phosphodiesterase n=1 Tax=Psychromonas hadalis TaxID=211669 RepID=UPI0003B382DE|nr:EAL domain-containing protein [Psychromonas hadalis]
MKKIWLLFYFLAFSGFCTLLTSVYLKHDELENRLQTEQRYVTQLFSSYISSAFFQFETMLDLISYEYSFQQSLKIRAIDDILARSPLLIGFALFNTDGTLQSSSRNLQKVNFPNLLTNNKTKQWFQQALQQNRMTIGGPYYLNSLKKWVVPIRKRIINSEGSVVGVIASGLDLQALSMQWTDGSNGQRTLQAITDNGFFRILRTNTPLNKYEKIYNTPIEEQITKKIKQQLALKKLTFDDLRKSEKSVQLQFTQGDQKRYSTILYNAKQQLWISVIESNYSLQQNFIAQITPYFIFYLIFLMIIFFLFKWIVHIEQNKIAELTYRAEHDLLTGLYNRTILKNRDLKYHKKSQPFSLLYIDLDHFKGINDSYGYSYGDSILVEVSKRIKRTLIAPNGTAIRLSADEFIVLIDSTDRVLIEEYSNTLLVEIAKPYIVNNNDFKISASIGITQSPKDATGMETLISYANNSMLIAKKTKNNCVFFSEKIHQQLIKNIEIEQALHSAISKGEISLVYQPQLDNQHQLCGVEALVRWNNESLGFIPPNQFIPIAEDSGLMPELGAYIMNRAMSEISKLQYKKEKAFQLSINVSAKQFVQLNFFEALIDCLTCYKSPYLKITIEITESLFIDNIERLLPIFQKMKDENISLSLDDFGTGYSSLSMLRNVPIDELKIDKSFVDHIVNNKSDRAMAASIITMGKNLGMTVLAEGVEDKQQAEILQAAGCDLYQGYYFSKPLNLADLEGFIDSL